MPVIINIFPILALTLFGWFTAKSRFLSRSECEALSRFTFNLVIPCLLFINTAHSDIPDDLGPGFLGAYYLAVILVYLLSMIAGRVLFSYTPVEQSVFAMGGAYSNSTIVGIPLVLQTLGQDAMLPLFLIISIQNLVLFTVGTIAAEREHFSITSLVQTVLNLLKQLLSSPLTVSLIAGLAVNLLNIPIYEPVDRSITLMSTAAIPLALFVLGTSLHQYKVNAQIPPAIAMTLLKVAVLPLLVWLFTFQVFEIDRLWATTAVLCSAMPVGISAYVFSSRYDACQGAVAAGSVLSTISSLLPVAIVLHLADTGAL